MAKSNSCLTPDIIVCGGCSTNLIQASKSAQAPGLALRNVFLREFAGIVW
jgi:hypothetical protein